MRHYRRAAAFLIAGLVTIAAGCTAGASVPGILAQHGISAKDSGGCKIELRFLKQSKGSNYMFEDISGNSDLFGELVKGLNASRSAEKPKEEKFSPELRSDCELVFTNGSGETVSFLYMIQDNMLVYPEKAASEDGETLEYRYFTGGEGLAGLLQGRQQYAAMMQDISVKPFRNMEELKSSIDPDELAEAGTEIDFEFFAESTPENAGTACRIYTSADCAAVPQDSYLITAYGKTETGEQEELWIQGMTTNDCYTKIIVTEPDEALESVDTGDMPDSHAITVKKDAVDPSKWIVFVDADNNVLDIILPEDIKR
jgi:hypothetical protein